MNLKIVRIRRHPRWKFWKTDQWEVTVEIDGKIEKVSIFKPTPYDTDIDESLFLEYMRNKVIYGTQWSYEVKQKRQSIKEMERKLKELVGREIPSP